MLEVSVPLWGLFDLITIYYYDEWIPKDKLFPSPSGDYFLTEIGPYRKHILGHNDFRPHQRIT